MVRKKSISGVNIGIYLYDTPLEIIETYFYGSIPDELYFYDTDGSTIKCTKQGMINRTIERGFWGWTEDKKDIHLWYDLKKVTMRDLIQLLSHEYGHTKRPYHKEKQKEEIKAGKYETNALVAYDIAANLIEGC